ncbi:MAG: hypothetical protein VX466_00680 [Myxococcota bacterium]|nr:hypothetical protein [Myxococcota bacterium]
MARKGKTGVLKRLREVKKAEKAALKREEMKTRRESVEEEPAESNRIATVDDMAGYGFPSDSEDVEETP